MYFVWFMSYLATFLVGGIVSLVAFYYLIEHSINKEERKLVNSAATKTLEDLLKPYTMDTPSQN